MDRDIFVWGGLVDAIGSAFSQNCEALISILRGLLNFDLQICRFSHWRIRYKLPTDSALLTRYNWTAAVTHPDSSKDLILRMLQKFIATYHITCRNETLLMQMEYWCVIWQCNSGIRDNALIVEMPALMTSGFLRCIHGAASSRSMSRQRDRCRPAGFSDYCNPPASDWCRKLIRRPPTGTILFSIVHRIHGYLVHFIPGPKLAFTAGEKHPSFIAAIQAQTRRQSKQA
jgi:hypothetical protein